MENAKNEKFKWDILGDFQTLCNMAFWQFMATQKGDWMETTIHQLHYAQE